MLCGLANAGEHSRSRQRPSLIAGLGGMTGGGKLEKWEKDLPGGPSTEDQARIAFMSEG